MIVFALTQGERKVDPLGRDAVDQSLYLKKDPSFPLQVSTSVQSSLKHENTPAGEMLHLGL